MNRALYRASKIMSAAISSTPSKFDYDLFVIGAGSGGVAASRRAAKYNARVGVAESDRIGGTCVNVGCVPKKLYVYGSSFREDLAISKGYGWTVDAKFDWATLVNNKDKEIARLNGVYKRMLDGSKVEYFQTKAVLKDAHTVFLADLNKSVTADRILIASGSHSFVPPSLKGKEHVITSNDCFLLKELPQSIVIIGAGYIGVEFACIFKNAGVKDVTLINRSNTILSGFDVDIRMDLAEILKKRGINIRLGYSVEEVAVGNSEIKAVHLKDYAGKPVKIEAHLVMYATGRVPNTQGFGLMENGIKLGNKGEIKVNEDLQTDVPNIYAIGDVTDMVNLTPVAIAQGRGLAETWFNNRPTKIPLDVVPRAVFSQPEGASVGMTEEEARAKFGKDNIDIYRCRFKPMKSGFSGVDEQVMMKHIVLRSSNKVIGCHMLGSGAAEIIQCLAVAVRIGATKAQFDTTLALHPTLSEEFVLMPDKSVSTLDLLQEQKQN